MDATDPALTKLAERSARAIAGVLDVHNIALRWLGHRQQGEMHITVDCQLSTLQSHLTAEQVRMALFRALPALAEFTVHVDPCECDQTSEYYPSGHVPR